MIPLHTSIVCLIHPIYKFLRRSKHSHSPTSRITLMTLGNNLLHRLRHNLMIILLLQPTNNSNTHQPRKPTHANRIRTPMNRIIIRNSTPIRTPKRILRHKSSLNLLGAHTSPQSTNHLLPHRPAGHPESQDCIPLPPHPVVVVRDCPVVCCALEDCVERSVARCCGCEGDGD